MSPQPFDQSLKYRQLIPVMLLLLLLGPPGSYILYIRLEAFSRLSGWMRHWPADYIIHERVANIMRAKRTDNISTAAGHSRVFHNDKPDLLFFRWFFLLFLSIKKYFFKRKKKKKQKKKERKRSMVRRRHVRAGRKEKEKEKRDKPVIFVTCP